MNDRDVFFGGRVEVFRNLYVADEAKDEQIGYVDAIS